MSVKIGRNDPCPCKSGLKLKKCHGDVVLQQIAKEATQTIMGLHIAERCIEAGLVEADDQAYLDGVKALSDKLAGLVPETIEINQVVAVVVPSVPEIDKLEEKYKAGGDWLFKVQETMVVCPTCGLRLPIGMTCAKCERIKNEHKTND